MKKITMVLVLALFFISAGAQKKYVLLVGVNNYGLEEDINLNYPVNDVKELKQVFKKQGAVVSIMTSRYVTQKNIEDKLNAIIKVAKPSDQIIFYFSGHGCPGAFICYQGKPFLYEDLVNLLSKAKTKKIFCFIDACHSGSSKNAALVNTGNPKKPAPIFCIACRPDETSVEVPFIDNGLFTQAVLKGLRGKADANGDRKITLIELFKYAYNDVTAKSKKIGRNQHPQLIGPTSLHEVVIAKW